MLDARKNPDAIRSVHEQLVAEGVELDNSFLQQYNQMLLKYTDTASSEAVSPPEVRMNGEVFIEQTCYNKSRLSKLFLGSPEFNSSTALVNSQQVSLLPVGILLLCL